MKMSKLFYPDKKYDGLYSLFIQRGIITMFLKDIVACDSISTAVFEVDAWRYVFEKDISKAKIIKNLTKSGVNNLVALQVIDKLNNARKMIEEIEKGEIK